VPKILIIYYTRTGNTDKMAKAVAEGARAVQGVDVEVNYYIPPEQLGSYDAFLLGVPTYHHDIPIGIKALLEEASVTNVNLKGKIGAAFGSYGWSGEAPKLTIEILKNKFGMNVTEPPLLLKYSPDQAGLRICKELGKRIAESLMH